MNHERVNFALLLNESAVAAVKPTEIGRRDWTRTNDPHHVKVVL